MKIYLLIILLLAFSASPVTAQDSAFPLPADLYILTSDFMIVRVDAANGEQTIISPPDQPVTDFAIAPDGAWYVYRTSANNAVIIAQLQDLSGFVLEFDAAMPPEPVGQSIVWSPDGSAVAYLVQEGVRIAELGAGDYGEALLSTIQGGPWTDVYWTNEGVLVRDEAGRLTQITGEHNAWTVNSPIVSATLPQGEIAATLTNEGVMFADQRLVPGTAGALAFDWGPTPLKSDGSFEWPNNLYFLMPDDGGITQVWQLSGEAARALTDEGTHVLNYDIALGQTQIAYTTATQLITANLDGSNRRDLAQLSTEQSFAFIDWSPDASQIAYSDKRGMWIVPADASQPPRLLLQNQREEAGMQDLSEFRVYFNPRWNPDSTQLLIGVGFYEGSVLGVVDVVTGEVTELGQIIASQGRWTNDGRVVTWSASWGYETPGLYILDPANPGAPPQAILDQATPVVDATQTPAGDWTVLVSASAQMGPQFLRVMAAESLNDSFELMYDAGGFAEMPQIAVSGDTIVAAGLRSITYDEARGIRAGQLVIIDMSSGETVQVDTGALVHQIQWGE